MPMVRRSSADIDREALLADLAKARARTEEEIEADAIEDGGALTDEHLARAILVHPPTRPEAVRAARARLGMTQAEFAHRFGFSIDTLQQYEDGSLIPSGPARTLLRLIEVDPDAVMRLLDPRHTRRSESAA